MILTILQTLFSALMANNSLIPTIKSLALWLMQQILQIDLKRNLTDSEVKNLKDAYDQSIATGNTLPLEQALDPNRHYPSS